MNCALLLPGAGSGERRGQTRVAASINPGKSADRLSLFYKTQGYADQGRPWFEALAGTAVRFVSRELADPKGVLSSRLAGHQRAAKAAGPSLPPEVMAEAIEHAIHRMYANWADEPIPTLDGFDIVGSAIFVLGSDPPACEFAINVAADYGGA